MSAGMAGSARDELVIGAPLAFTWAAATDLRAWPRLLAGCDAVEVVEESPDRIRARMTSGPDARGAARTWESERRLDTGSWTVHAVDIGATGTVRTVCSFSEAAPDRTRVRRMSTGSVDASDPVARAVAARLGELKAGVEARRARVLSAVDVPENRRRGGDVRTLLSPATVGSTAGFSGSACLEPGEVITEHYHPYSEEFIHVVSGRVRIELPDGARTLTAGQAVLVPREVRHRMANAGTEPVRVVFFLSPLAPRPDLGHVDTESLESPRANAEI